jgi:hypothetical protein
MARQVWKPHDTTYQIELHDEGVFASVVDVLSYGLNEQERRNRDWSDI